MKVPIFLLLSLAALAAVAEKQPLERYQTIIDRMPCGVPPPGFDPNRSPDDVSRNEAVETGPELTQDQEALQKAVQFSVINVEEDGTVRIGFSDKSDSSTPRHYYLAVGEERGGWLVKAADPLEKTMTVVKDGVEVQLRLGDNSGGDGKGGKGRAASVPRPMVASGAQNRPASVPSPMRSNLLARGGTDANTAATSLKSRRERHEAEMEAERQARERAEAESKRLAEEMRQSQEEEKAAREAERAEQRELLKAMQEELRRSREEKERAREDAAANGAEEDAHEED